MPSTRGRMALLLLFPKFCNTVHCWFSKWLFIVFNGIFNVTEMLTDLFFEWSLCFPDINRTFTFCTFYFVYNVRVSTPGILYTHKHLSGGVSVLCWHASRKTQNTVEGHEILLPVRFRWIPFSGYRWKAKKIRKAVSEEKSKMSQPIRGQNDHLFFFSIRPKNSNLAKDIGILMSDKFYWILFSDFRSRNRLSQPIRDQGYHPNFTILVEDIDTLLLVKFRWVVLVVSKKKSKMWKVKDDARRTDGRRTMHDRLRCTKSKKCASSPFGILLSMVVWVMQNNKKVKVNF